MLGFKHKRRAQPKKNSPLGGRASQLKYHIQVADLLNVELLTSSKDTNNVNKLTFCILFLFFEVQVAYETMLIKQNVNPNEHFKHFSSLEKGKDVGNLVITLLTTSSLFLVQPSTL